MVVLLDINNVICNKNMIFKTNHYFLNLFQHEPTKLTSKVSDYHTWI